MSQILMIMIRDGLQMPSGFVAESPKRCLIYCKVPDDWVEGEIPASSDLWLGGTKLKADKLELLLETLYGRTWRSGNEDGSQYVVLNFGMRVRNPLESWEPPAFGEEQQQKYLFFYYAVDTNGQFATVAPNAL